VGRKGDRVIVGRRPDRHRRHGGKARSSSCASSGAQVLALLLHYRFARTSAAAAKLRQLDVAGCARLISFAGGI